MKKLKYIFGLILIGALSLGSLTVLFENQTSVQGNYVFADDDVGDTIIEYQTINRVYTDEDISTFSTIFEDVDKDGILDIDDPNPEIPEVFVVRDDNKNGIVDSFENND